MIDIVVKKRSDDYHASLADNPAVWEAGKSQAEAIGKLIISARSLVGIAIMGTCSVPTKPTKPAFGIFDYNMIPKLRRLLKAFGMRMIVRHSTAWGDQVEIKLERE